MHQADMLRALTSDRLVGLDPFLYSLYSYIPYAGEQDGSCS